jgi:hypothetical protein
MSKRDSNWYIPSDWLWHLGMFLMIPCIAILAGVLLPVVARLKTADVGVLYGVGLAAGIVGVLLLFIARLPLYRERRFWTLGPRQLDEKHRRFYWMAYIAVAVSLLLFWIVWLRIS